MPSSGCGRAIPRTRTNSRRASRPGCIISIRLTRRPHASRIIWPTGGDNADATGPSGSRAGTTGRKRIQHRKILGAATLRVLGRPTGRTRWLLCFPHGVDLRWPACSSGSLRAFGRETGEDMGLIAEKCPRCNRVTKCSVTGSSGFVGGLIFGVPIILPTSTVQCVCGECGHSFRSRPSVEERAIPAELAAGLDIDALLGLTNPDLKQARILSELRSDSRLRNAFALFDRLPPCPLKSDLEADLAKWPSLVEPGRADLLGRVDKCSEAEEFAQAMAGRYSLGATGCLLGVAVAAGVWIAAWLTLDIQGTLGWTLVGILGLAAASVPHQLLSASRDRRWVREVLLPEADRARVPLAWVLAVIEKSGSPRGARDELGSLRDIAPAIRAELDAGNGSRGSEVAGFGPGAGDQRMSGKREQNPGAG